MDFLKYSKIYFIFSGSLILASFIFLLVFGLKFGIDFKGGSILEIEFVKKRPPLSELRDLLQKQIKKEFIIQEAGKKGILIKAKEIDESLHQKILKALKKKGEIREKRFEMIGPAVGRELKRKTLIALIIAFIFITLYIALAFRKATFLISSWQYGLSALIALFHDIFITCGIFALLGKFLNIEVNIPFVAALLTILGYSINDTIVVFDRCRENLKKRQEDFKTILNISLSETLARSLFTSLTTLLVLFAILLFGGETLFSFVLTLIIGISLGTYSSIFIATPLCFLFSKKKVK